MSNKTEYHTGPSEQTLALFLQDNDIDKLTDVLVAALYDAFRILEEDSSAETLH